MALVETTSTDTAPVTLTDAKQQLRYFDDDQDAHISTLIAAATDWAERKTQRTLRVSVTRRLDLACWWVKSLVLPWPPFSSLTSVVYYDEDNSSQTLASSNYEVVTDTEGATRIVWATDATIPGLYDREDAVQVTYVTGYQAADSVPDVVKQAVKLLVKVDWGQDDAREVEQAQKRANDLLSSVEWPRYG